jgi:hypothetical protein
MQKSSVQIFNTGEHVDPLTKQSFTKHKKWMAFANGLISMVQGRRQPTTCQRDTCAAYSTFTATSSGDFTITINGVDTVTAFDTSATVTATAAVAALNALTANALCYGGRNIEADNRQATITLTSCAAGVYFTIGGFILRAVAKAADVPGTFEISGSDTADAQKLVAAINTYPGLNDLVVADNSSGVVTVRSRRASTATNKLYLLASGEAISAGVLTASSVVTVSSVRKGQPGNAITTAVTGTGSAVSGARMTGGTTTHETL